MREGRQGGGGYINPKLEIRVFRNHGLGNMSPGVGDYNAFFGGYFFAFFIISIF